MRGFRAFTALVLAVALGAPAGALGDEKDMCEDRCWKKLKSKLKECREDFPEVTDPLRKSCGEAARSAYDDCLDDCDEKVGLPVTKHIVFASSTTDSPQRFSVLLDDDRRAARRFLTVLNGDGQGGGIDHLRVLLDRRVVYENNAFDAVAAAEIPLDLEPGAYALTLESEGTTAGTITVFVSDRPLADRSDLEGKLAAGSTRG